MAIFLFHSLLNLDKNSYFFNVVVHLTTLFSDSDYIASNEEVIKVNKELDTMWKEATVA
jgi:hypothetical protein